MYYFTIRDVENLSGIKAHTLRTWEQRYGLCICKRRKSQHRYYDNEDLKYILRIAYLYHNGYRISRIAAFSPGEINQLASKRFNTDEEDVLVNQLIESCLDYNQLQFEKSLRGMERVMGIENSVEKIIYPFLDKIGLLWMTNRVLPAQEHFCSYLIQKFIITAINALPNVPQNNSPRYLLFTPQGEMHELPLLLMQYILKKKGLKTMLLGKNVSTDMVQYCCTHQPVTHLFFHLITNFTNCNTCMYIARLAEQFPQLQIIASGPAVKELKNIPVNVQILQSLKDVIAFPLPGETIA